MDYNEGMDVEQLRQDVREGRVKLEWLIELLVAQQRKLAEAATRIRELEEALDALRKQSSPTAKLNEPFSVKAEEKRQAARGRKSKKKTKPRRRGRLRSADKLALAKDLPLRKSQVDALLHQLAQHWHREFDHLCTLLANSAVVHADETSWSINSVWAFLSEKARVFFFGVHKDSETLKQILDAATFAGIVISDDAAVYGPFNKSQKCWAHLLRKAIKLTLQCPGNSEYRHLADELLDLDVQRADIGQDRRLFVAGIPEVKRPFHGRKVAALDTHAAQHHPSARIAIGECVLCSFLIEEPACALDCPRPEHFGRWPTVVGERKERFGMGCRVALLSQFRRSRLEFRRSPFLGLGHLVGGRRGGRRQADNHAP